MGVDGMIVILILMLISLGILGWYFRNDIRWIFKKNIAWFKAHWKKLVAIITSGLLIGGGAVIMSPEPEPISLGDLYVDDDFNPSTPGWGTTHFDTIQNATNNASSNDNIYIWEGTYVEDVLVTQSVNYIGNSSSTVIVAFGTSYGFYNSNAVNTVTWRGLNITGSNENSGYGIRIRNRDNFNISKCVFYRCADQIYFDIDVNNVTIYDCDFSIFNNGIYGVEDIGNVTVSHCNFTANNDYPLTFGQNSDNITVHNCSFDTYNDVTFTWTNDTIVTDCFFLGGTGIWYYDDFKLTISNCNFYMNGTSSAAAIMVDGCSGVYVLNNTVIDFDNPLSVLDPTDNINISHNYFEGASNGETGIGFWYPGNNITIYDNIIRNFTVYYYGGQSGIELEECSNITIYSNNITGCEYGILIFTDLSDALIYNNYLSNNASNVDTDTNVSDNNVYWNTTKTLGTNIIGGPYLGGNYWSDYTGNDTDNDGLGDENLPWNTNISAGGDYHPLVEFNGTFIYVDDDFDSGTPGWGVTHFDSIYNATHNTSSGDVVYIWNGTYSNSPTYLSTYINNSITIIGNSSTNTSYAYGDKLFHIQANNVHISGLKLEQSNQNIWFDGYDNINISDCEIDDATAGIWCANTTGVEIYNCNFTASTTAIKFDVYVNDSYINNSEVWMSGSLGVDIENSTNNFINNCLFGYSISNSGVRALYSNQLEITDSTMSGCYYGTYFDHTENVTIEHCNISGGTGHGICIWRECYRFNISNTSIYDNGDGIWWEDVWNEYFNITNCTIDECDGYGIWIEFANYTNISHCDITDNAWSGGDVGVWVYGCHKSFIMYNCTIHHNNMGFIADNENDNISLIDCTITNNTEYYGLVLRNQLDDVLIENCTIWDSNEPYGNVEIEGSDVNNITLRNCTIGYTLYDPAEEPWSVYVYDVVENITITGCNITDSYIGVCFEYGPINCTVYNNYFDNVYNVGEITGGTADVTWNITKTSGTNVIGGSYLGGNYWADYNGSDMDFDGIGDTNVPYTSHGNITTGDYLPLTSNSYVEEIIRISGLDYFVWYGNSTSAYHVKQIINTNNTVFDESDEYLYLWNTSATEYTYKWANYSGTGAGDNFTVDTFDILKIELNDAGNANFTIDLNTSSTFWPRTEVCTKTSANKGYNYIGWTNTSSTTLNTITLSNNLQSGDYIALWNETTFKWNFWFAKFTNPSSWNKNVHTQDVLLAYVKSTRNINI